MSIAPIRVLSEPSAIRDAWHIARNYLERTGQIEDDSTSYFILSRVFERLTRTHIPKTLLLANRAISEYERLARGTVWLV
jgi:hypothetical protein